MTYSITSSRRALDLGNDQEPSLQALGGLPAQQLVYRHARGHRIIRKEIAPELKPEIAPARDRARVFQRLGDILEQGGHLRAAAEILLRRVALRAPGVGQHPAVLDADPDLVRLEIRGPQE